MKFRLMAEREIAAKEHKFGLIDGKKEELRRFHDQMSSSVRLMSTKLPLGGTSSGGTTFEARESRSHLDQILRELENKQRQLLRTQYLKQALEDNKEITVAQAGVKGQVSEAVGNLTMLARECKDDFISIDIQLQASKEELRKRTSLNYKQEAELKNNEREYEQLQSKLEAMTRQ